jgi:hypothetical protein
MLPPTRALCCAVLTSYRKDIVYTVYTPFALVLPSEEIRRCMCADTRTAHAHAHAYVHVHVHTTQEPSNTLPYPWSSLHTSRTQEFKHTDTNTMQAIGASTGLHSSVLPTIGGTTPRHSCTPLARAARLEHSLLQLAAIVSRCSKIVPRGPHGRRAGLQLCDLLRTCVGIAV